MNKIQELQLELMKLASFNSFDGNEVVKDLLKHQDLWKGCIIDRAGYSRAAYQGCIDLIKLRDIEDGIWNVDTIYILTSGVDDKKLEKLAKKWNADEIDFLSDEDAGRSLGEGPTNHKVLRIWWD
jgi:hypothetical protein